MADNFGITQNNPMTTAFGPRLKRGQTLQSFIANYSPSDAFKAEYQSLGAYPTANTEQNTQLGGTAYAASMQSIDPRTRYEQRWKSIYDREQQYKRQQQRAFAGSVGQAYGDKNARNDAAYQQALQNYAQGKGLDPGEYGTYQMNSLVQSIHKNAQNEDQSRYDMLDLLKTANYNNLNFSQYAADQIQSLKEKNPTISTVDESKIPHSEKAQKEAAQGLMDAWAEEDLDFKVRRLISPQKYLIYSKLPTLALKQKYANSLIHNDLMKGKTLQQLENESEGTASEKFDNLLCEVFGVRQGKTMAQDNTEFYDSMEQQGLIDGNPLEFLQGTAGHIGNFLYKNILNPVIDAGDSMTDSFASLFDVGKGNVYDDFLKKTTQDSDELSDEMSKDTLAALQDSPEDTEDMRKYKQRQRQQVKEQLDQMLDQNSAWYHKLKKEDPEALKNLDYNKLFSNLLADEQLLGEQAASQHLMETVQNNLADYEQNNHMFNYWKEAALNCGSQFMADVSASTLSAVAIATNIFGGVMNGFDFSENALQDEDSASYWLLKRASDIQQTGCYKDETIKAYYDTPEQLRLASFQNLYRADEQDSFTHGSISGMFSDLVGQYGFTVGSMLASCGFSGIAKGISWGAQKSLRGAILRKAMLSTVLGEEAAATAEAASTVAEKSMAKTMMGYYSQTINALKNPLETTKSLLTGARDNSIFRKGLQKEFNALEQSTKFAARRRAAESMARLANRAEKASAYMVGAATGSSEGAIEAKSTYDDFIKTGKEMADSQYDYNHQDEIQKIYNEVLNDTDAIEAEASKDAAYKEAMSTDAYMASIKDPAIRQKMMEQKEQLLNQARSKAAEALFQKKLAWTREQDPMYKNNMEQLSKQALAAGSANFWFNSCINGALNNTLKASLMDKSVRETLAQRHGLLKNSIRFVKDNSTKFGFKVALKEDKHALLGKLWDLTKKDLKSSFGEGVEEWSQNLSNQFSQEFSKSAYGTYLMSAYSPQSRDALANTISSFASDSTSKALTLWDLLTGDDPDAMHAAMEGTVKTAISQEAMYEGLYGMLSTMIGGPSINTHGVWHITKSTAQLVASPFSKKARTALKENQSTLATIFNKDNWSNLIHNTPQEGSTIGYRDYVFKKFRDTGFAGFAKKVGEKFQEYSPINYSGGIFNDYNEIKNQKETVSKMVDRINGILSSGNNDKIWNLLNAQGGLKTLREEALVEGDEKTAKDFNRMLTVQTALILAMAMEDENGEGKSLAKHFISPFQQAAGIDLENISFDEKGNLLMDMQEPQAPTQPQLSPDMSQEQVQQALAQYRQQVQQYEEQKQAYDDRTKQYANLASLAQSYGTEGSESKMSDKEKLTRMSTKAKDMFDLINTVNERSKELETIYGESINFDTRVAFLQEDLLLDDQMRRQKDLEQRFNDFKQSISQDGTLVNSKFGNDERMRSLVAQYGTVDQIKKDIKELEARKERLYKNDPKEVEQLNGKNIHDAIKDLDDMIAAVKDNQDYMEAFLKENNVQSGTVVLSIKDIMDMDPHERVWFLSDERRKHYSKEQLQVIDRLEGMADRFYNDNTEFSSDKQANIFSKSIQDQVRLEDSINYTIETIRHRSDNIERIRELNAMLDVKEKNRIIRQKYANLLDSDKYTDYSTQYNAIQNKLAELKQDGSPEALNEARIIEQSYKNNKALKEYIALSNLIRRDVLTTPRFSEVAKDLTLAARMLAMLEVVISNKKYEGVKGSIVNFLKYGGNLDAKQRMILEGILRNKEYVQYLKTLALNNEKLQDAANKLADEDIKDSLTQDQISDIIQALLDLFYKEAKSSSTQVTAENIVHDKEGKSASDDTHSKPSILLSRGSRTGTQVTLGTPMHLNGAYREEQNFLNETFNWEKVIGNIPFLRHIVNINNSNRNPNGSVFMRIKLDSGKILTVAALQIGSKQDAEAYGLGEEYTKARQYCSVSVNGNRRVYMPIGIYSVEESSPEDTTSSNFELVYNADGSVKTFVYGGETGNGIVSEDKEGSLNIPQGGPGTETSPNTVESLIQKAKAFFSKTNNMVVKGIGNKARLWVNNMIVTTIEDFNELRWKSMNGTIVPFIESIKEMAHSKELLDNPYSKSPQDNWIGYCFAKICNPTNYQELATKLHAFGGNTGVSKLEALFVYVNKTNLGKITSQNAVERNEGINKSSHMLYFHEANMKVQVTEENVNNVNQIRVSIIDAQSGTNLVVSNVVLSESDSAEALRDKMLTLLEDVTTKKISLPSELNNVTGIDRNFATLQVNYGAVLSFVENYHKMEERLASPDRRRRVEAIQEINNIGRYHYAISLYSLGVFASKDPSLQHPSTIIKIIPQGEPSVVLENPVLNQDNTTVEGDTVIDDSTGEIIQGSEVSDTEVAKGITNAKVQQCTRMVEAIRQDVGKPVLAEANADHYESNVESGHPTIWQRVTTVLQYLRDYTQDPYDADNDYHVKAVSIGNSVDLFIRAFFSIIEESTSYQNGVSPTGDFFNGKTTYLGTTDAEHNPVPGKLADVIAKAKELFLEDKRQQLQEAYPGLDETQLREKVNEIFSTIPNITESALIDLLRNLERLQEYFGLKGWFVVPTGISAYGHLKTEEGETVNTAGTLDLLVYDTEGKFRIIDIKTMHYENGVKIQDSEDTIEKIHGEEYGHEERWSAQVSIYKKLLSEQYPFLEWAEDSCYILPIGVVYERDKHTALYDEVAETDSLTSEISLVTKLKNGRTVVTKDALGNPIKRTYSTNRVSMVSAKPENCIVSVPVMEDVTLSSELVKDADISISENAKNIPIETMEITPTPVTASPTEENTISEEAQEPAVVVSEDAPLSSHLDDKNAYEEHDKEVISEEDDEDEDELNLSTELEGIESVHGILTKRGRFGIKGVSRKSTLKRIPLHRAMHNFLEQLLTKKLGINSSQSILLEMGLDIILTSNPKIVTARLLNGLKLYYSSKLSSINKALDNAKFLSQKEALLYRVFTNNITADEYENTLKQLHLTEDELPQIAEFRVNGSSEYATALMSQYSSLEELLKTHQAKVTALQEQKQHAKDLLAWSKSFIATQDLLSFLSINKEIITRAMDTHGRYGFTEEASLLEYSDELTDLNRVLSENKFDTTKEHKATDLLQFLSQNTSGMQKLILTKLAVLLLNSKLSVSFEHTTKPGLYGTTSVIADVNGAKATHITINLANIKDIKQLSRTMAHETIHAMTHFLVQDDAVLKVRLNGLLDYARQYLKRVSNTDPDSIYGLTSPTEFIAEFFSNDLFQQTLKNIPAQDSKSIFDKVINYISKAIFKNGGSLYDLIEKEMQDIIALSASLSDAGTIRKSKRSFHKEVLSVREALLNIKGPYAYISELERKALKSMKITAEEFNMLSKKARDKVLSCCR